MLQGVTLLSIGSEGYLMWAVNMACTIKHYSPGVAIQLITTKNIEERIKRYGFEKVFDHFTIIEETEYTENGKLAPGKLKLALPQHFIFDRTIYFDVDGCIIKDITPLFENPGKFITHVNATYALGDIEDPGFMYWCKSSSIMNQYHLPPVATLPAINSSFYLFEKSPETMALFKQAYQNITENPIPAERRNKSWGRSPNLQPDELYLNIACAQTNTYPVDLKPFYFRDKLKTGPVPEVNEIRKTFYGIGLYGDENYNHPSVKSIYDRNVRHIFEATFPGSHFMKAHQLCAYKIANNKI